MTVEQDIKPAINIEMKSLDDLIHWLIANSTDKQVPLCIYEQESKYIYFSLIIIPGYYDLKGLPLLGYYSSSDKPKSRYLRFDVREEAVNKAISYVKGFDDRDSNMGYIQYFPLIELKTKPFFLQN